MAKNHTFWSQDLDKRVSESNAVFKKMKNGELVTMELNSYTKEAHQRRFQRLRIDFAKQDWDDDVIPILRQTDKVYFSETEKKTQLDIERDRTVQGEVEGAIGGRDDNDDEYINLGIVSKAANVARARDHSSVMKNGKTSYVNKLALHYRHMVRLESLCRVPRNRCS